MKNNDNLLKKKTKRTKNEKFKESNSKPNKKQKNSTVEFFSPNNPNKLNKIIEKLESAKTSLDIAMYTLTNIQLINTILQCLKNKVKIRIVLDYQMTQKFGYFLQDLLMNGISIKTNDNPEENMHHKFAIIDKKFVFNGSLNWSEKGVSKSHENILLLENEQIVSDFSDQFNTLWNKFNNNITLNDIQQNGKFYFEKKYLPKQYYRNFNRYRNYFDRYGYRQEQFIEDDDYYEDEEFDDDDDEGEEEEEEEEDDGYDDYSDNRYHNYRNNYSYNRYNNYRNNYSDNRYHNYRNDYRDNRYHNYRDDYRDNIYHNYRDDYDDDEDDYGGDDYGGYY